MPPELTLTLPPEACHVAVARRVTDAFFETLNVPIDTRQSLYLAISEAVSNAVRHGQGDMTLKAQVTVATLTVTVQNRSDWQPPQPPLPMPAPHAEQGRGLPLLYALMDTVTITQAEGVVTVRLVKTATA
jgi:serine/threonine-protein kinase RsbW